MRYRLTMRFYQWVVDRPMRLRWIDAFLVWQINRMQRHHRDTGKWQPKVNRRFRKLDKP